MEDFEYVLSDEQTQKSMHELQKLQSMVKELEHQKALKQVQVQSLEQAQKKHQYETEQLESRMKNLKTEVCHKEMYYETILEKNQKKINEFETKLKDSQQNQHTQSQQIDAQNQNQQKLSQQLKSTTERLLQTTNQIQELKEYSESVEKDFDDSLRSVQQKDSRIYGLEQKLMEFQKKSSVLLQEQETLYQKIKDLQTKLHEKDSKLKEKDTEVQKLKNQLQDCVIQLEKNRKEFYKYETIQQELHREREKLQNQNKLLVQDFSDLMKVKESDFETQQGHIKEINNLKQQIKEIKDKLENQKSQNTEKDVQLKESRNNTKQLVEKIQEQQTQIQNYKDLQQQQQNGLKQVLGIVQSQSATQGGILAYCEQGSDSQNLNNVDKNKLRQYQKDLENQRSIVMMSSAAQMNPCQQQPQLLQQNQNSDQFTQQSYVEFSEQFLKNQQQQQATLAPSKLILTTDISKISKIPQTLLMKDKNNNQQYQKSVQQAPKSPESMDIDQFLTLFREKIAKENQGTSESFQRLQMNREMNQNLEKIQSFFSTLGFEFDYTLKNQY